MVLRHPNGREMVHGKESHFFLEQIFMLILAQTSQAFLVSKGQASVFLHLMAKHLACAMRLQ